MTSRFGPATGILLLALPLIAACSGNSANVGPTPLPAAPTGPVVSQPLPTATQTAQTPDPLTDDTLTPGATGLEEQQQVAAVAPPASSKPTKEEVLGQWRLSGPSDSCQLNVALTTWTGGFRASTRGCASPELTSVGAWNIEGDLVVLKDNDGNAVARLAKAGPTQFNGRLDLGGSVSMSR